MKQFLRELPANHDIDKTTRIAALEALEHLARIETEVPEAFTSLSESIARQNFNSKVKAFTKSQIKKARRSNFSSRNRGFDQNTINAALAHLESLDGRNLDTELKRLALQDFRGEIVRELTPPAEFMQSFDGHLETPSWWDCFAILISENIKENDRFESIFVANSLVSLRTGNLEILAILEEQQKLLETSQANASWIISNTLEIGRMIRENSEIGLSKVQVVNVLANFGKAGIPPHLWESELNKSAERLRSLERHLVQISGGTRNEFDGDLANSISRAIEAGDFLAADTLISEAALRRKKLAQRSISEFAELKSQRGDLALLRGLTGDAGRHYEEAANAVRDHSWEEYVRYSILQATALLERSKFETNLDNLYNSKIKINEIMGEGRQFEDYFECKYLAAKIDFLEAKRNKDAEALSSLFSSTSDFYFEHEANIPLEQKLKFLNLLATIQGAIGLREVECDALRSSRELFSKAKALAESKLELRPVEIEWAAACNGYAEASTNLYNRGEEVNFEMEIIANFENALSVRDFKKMPDEWAETQNRYAIALEMKGDREQNSELLQSAIKRYKQSLSKRQFRRRGIDIAGSYTDLGSAYEVLAKLENDDRYAVSAIDYYHSSLDHFRKNDGMILWASNHHNIGEALLTRYGLRNDGKYATKAKAHFLKSSKVFAQLAPRYLKLSQDGLKKCDDILEQGSE
jgi:hypothetical protein